MSKKILVLGLSGLMLLSGCQSISDQIGKQIAKTVVEQGSGGKVKIDDLDQGKFKVQTEDGTIEVNGNGQNGGGVTVTDKNGKQVMNANSQDGTFSVKDESGKEVISGDQNKVTVKGDNGETAVYGKNSDTRPADAPAELPSLDGAKNFSLVVIGDNKTLGYDLDSTDLKGTCQKQIDLLLSNGWVSTDSKNFTFATDTSMLKSYTKNGLDLLLTCGVTDSKMSIALSEGKSQPQ